MADNTNRPAGVGRSRHNVGVDQTMRSDPSFSRNNVLVDVPADYLQMNLSNANVMNVNNLTNKKKSSFQITSVTAAVKQEILEADADSMDDLDETHTEDVSSEVLDWSKTTDVEPDASSVEENLVGETSSVKESKDTTSRFKVVKIATNKEPYKRGRWMCSDFSDEAASEKVVTDFKGDEFPVPGSGTSSAASSVHYVPDQGNDMHEDILKDPSLQYIGKADSGMLLDEDSDYEHKQRRPSTIVKVIPDSGQQGITDVYKQMGQGNVIPGNNITPSTHPQSVQEFTNAPPVLQNVPQPQQSHVTTGNNQATDSLNSATNNVPGNAKPPASSHILPPQTLSNAISNITQGSTVNNSELNSGNMVSDSAQFKHGSSVMGAGAPTGGAQVNLLGQGNGNHSNHNNGNVSQPEFHHQNNQHGQRDIASNTLLSQQTQTSSTTTNTLTNQRTNNVQTNDYSVQKSQNAVPRIQVTTQTQFESEAAKGGKKEEPVVNDEGAAKDTSKDEFALDMAESAEKTQLLLEQMVQQSAGMTAALGSPIKDGEGDESGSSTVAIDNKIEQAMDLVKSHLMFAVREEVEVLREQIKELLEQKQQLEYENTVLKSAASSETLAKLANGPPPQPPTTSAS